MAGVAWRCGEGVELRGGGRSEDEDKGERGVGEEEDGSRQGRWGARARRVARRRAASCTAALRPAATPYLILRDLLKILLAHRSTERCFFSLRAVRMPAGFPLVILEEGECRKVSQNERTQVWFASVCAALWWVWPH